MFCLIDLFGMLIICSIVLVLSLVSFGPQIYHVLSLRDNSGISICYVLLNSMMFTEHFALSLHFTVNNTGVEDTIVGSPPTAENWLDLLQFCIVWYCYLML